MTENMPKPTLESLLSGGYIHQTLDALERSASGDDCRHIRERVSALREQYGYLTRYALEGAPDPTRADQYDDICASVRDLAASLRRQRMMADSSALYFSTLRAYAMQPGHSAAAAVAEVLAATARKSMSVLDSGGESAPGLSMRLESAEKRLFNALWTTHPLTPDDAAAVRRLMESPAVSSHVRQLTVAALMAGELEWHDDTRLELLAESYGSADSNVSVKALTGLFTALWMHRHRPMRRRVAQAVAALADNPAFRKDAAMMFLQLIRARDTERVNRKIHDEILPDLMKMKPDLEKRLRDSRSTIDPASFDMNPEWEEMLDNSGLKDRLKEISELQEDGADVMMSTFGTLKSFPFFNEIHHWFTPFRIDHPSVNQGGDEAWMAFVDVVSNAGFLCDNDKYSLACAFSMMPADRRDLLLGQFKLQNEHVAQMKASTLTTADTDREAIANGWIQSLYRFYKLFRRKGEFDDIFADPINPLEIPLLAPLLDDADTLTLAAEFYFKRGYWREAYDLFSHTATLAPATPQLFQKMGHCCQRLGDITAAITHYEHSELLNADSLWTLRRLGACHRMAGNPSAALPYLQRVADAKPDDLNAALALGHCLTELGRYDEAVKQFYKVEFHRPDSDKALRPLAWALMLAGDTDKAQRYIARLLESSSTPTDFLNAGHLELLTGNLAEASARYHAAFAMMDSDRARFIEAFDADRPLLTARGADPLLIKIIVDSALSSPV